MYIKSFFKRQISKKMSKPITIKLYMYIILIYILSYNPALTVAIHYYDILKVKGSIY